MLVSGNADANGEYQRDDSLEDCGGTGFPRYKQIISRLGASVYYLYKLDDVWICGNQLCTFEPLFFGWGPAATTPDAVTVSMYGDGVVTVCGECISLQYCVCVCVYRCENMCV